MREKYIKLNEKIKTATAKIGKNPSDIKIIAVSKTYPISAIEAAFDLGMHYFGENKVQELVGKMESINLPIEWHLIGHLQKNKVKFITGKVELIHSVDSIEIAQEINKRAKAINVYQNILLQVNIANEESKFGFKTEDIFLAIDEIQKLGNISIVGLMTMAPNYTDKEDARPIFKTLKNLADLVTKKYNTLEMKWLSMGMSGDFEIAIEEGANIIRVGSGIFGERNYSQGEG